jgi:hypothetical protein
MPVTHGTAILVSVFRERSNSGLAPFYWFVAVHQFRSGALGGFQLGYNRQFNQVWLAGLDTDFVSRPTSF